PRYRGACEAFSSSRIKSFIHSLLCRLGPIYQRPGLEYQSESVTSALQAFKITMELLIRPHFEPVPSCFPPTQLQLPITWRKPV
ncbi:hypothetical protein WG66_008092, partial [Moniliophthora roreri]